MASVKLISHTSPSPELIWENLGEKSITTIQDLIAFCARVSNPNNQHNTNTSEKLITYLIKNKHFSPFEMVNVCLEINTTRDIARQILRHRSFSFQEFSQRYADPTKELGFEYREARLQDVKNRQNSIDTQDKELHRVWLEKQQEVIRAAKDAYQFAILNGIAKEQARAVLPEGLTTSRMYVNGTIRSWIHYIETRLDVSTQKEHREIAMLCAKELAKHVPSIFRSLSEPSITVSEYLGL